MRTILTLRGETKGSAAPAGAQSAMMQCLTESLRAGQGKAGG